MSKVFFISIFLFVFQAQAESLFSSVDFSVDKSVRAKSSSHGFNNSFSKYWSCRSEDIIFIKDNVMLKIYFVLQAQLSNEAENIAPPDLEGSLTMIKDGEILNYSIEGILKNVESNSDRWGQIEKNIYEWYTQGSAQTEGFISFKSLTHSLWIDHKNCHESKRGCRAHTKTQTVEISFTSDWLVFNKVSMKCE